jgi:hypothetical protein
MSLLLIAGCQGVSRQEITIVREECNARLLWQTADVAFTPCSVGLSSSGERLAVGSLHSKVQLIHIGKMAPFDEFMTHYNRVSAVEFSPDGRYLAWTSIDQPDHQRGLRDAPMDVAIVDISSGRNFSIDVTEKTQHSILQFSPDSQYICVQNARSLRVVHLSSSRVILHVGGTMWGYPSFFEQDGTLQLVASERQWQLEGVVATFSRALPGFRPQTMSPDGQIAFRAIPPNWADEVLPLTPWIVLDEGGILEMSFDRNEPRNFMKLSGFGDCTAQLLEYLPSGQNDRTDRLLAYIRGGVNGDKIDLLSIDPRRRRYQSLLPATWKRKFPNEVVFDADPATKRVLIGGPMGLLIWEL